MAACSLSRSVSMTEPVVLETHNMSRRSILRILLPVPISPKPPQRVVAKKQVVLSDTDAVSAGGLRSPRQTSHIESIRSIHATNQRVLWHHHPDVLRRSQPAALPRPLRRAWCTSWSRWNDPSGQAPSEGYPVGARVGLYPLGRTCRLLGSSRESRTAG